MLFWSIGKFKLVELGYVTLRGSLENLSPKQKWKESLNWGRPWGLRGFALCSHAVWTQGFIHSRRAAQPSFLVSSASWIAISKKKKAVAHICDFTLLTAVTPSSCPSNSGTAKPRQDPGFPVGIALCSLWIMGGNSGCFMVFLPI